MNKVKLFEKEKALLKNPEYIKDWEQIYTVPDEHLLYEIQKKYGIKKLPNPNYDPHLRVHRKIKPTPNPKKHIPLENFYRPRAEGGVREDDPPEVKRDYAEYKRYRKEREKWEIPISDNELATWEQLRISGQFFRLRKAHSKKVEAWILSKPDLVNELLQPNPVRKMLIKQMGVPSSPLLGFSSLTAWVVTRLFGISNQELFQRLQNCMKKIHKSEFRKKRKKQIEFALTSSDSDEKMRLKAKREIQEKDEELSEIPYHLMESIRDLSDVPKQAIEAVESYLYTCIKKAFFKKWKKEKKKGMTGVPSYRIDDSLALEEEMQGKMEMTSPKFLPLDIDIKKEPQGNPSVTGG